MSSNPPPSDEIDNKSNESDKPNKMVTIFVSPGPDQKDGAFLLPHDLAVEASPVFRAALAGENWLEKDDQSMTLRDVDPEVFELLVYYLENEGLVPPCRTLGTPSEALVKYAKLWMLADLLNMPLLQNIVSKVMQWWIVDMGLHQLEDFMHLVYGRDSEYPEGERGILGKMLRFKFYYSEKEDLDICGYEIIPEMMKALMNTSPAFDEFSPEMVEALLKTGSTFQGYSPEMMKDLMKAGPVFRTYSPDIRNALIEAGEDIGEYTLAKNTGRWWISGSRQKGVPAHVNLGPAGLVRPARPHRYNLRRLNKFPWLHSAEEYSIFVFLNIVIRTEPGGLKYGMRWSGKSSYDPFGFFEFLGE